MQDVNDKHISNGEHWWDARYARVAGLLATASALLAGLGLAFLYRDIGGPGDQLTYYRTAQDLIPFDNQFYGPVYFVALRTIHEITHLDWFGTGKLTSWLSAVGFLWVSYGLLRRLLPGKDAWLALALVALNPTFVGQSYVSSTIVFGALWPLAALLLLVLPWPRMWQTWLAGGILFGIGYLTRFQNLSLLLGAALGTLALPNAKISDRLQRIGWLLAGAAAPVLIWDGFLLMVQGHLPESQNFVHLTSAFGEFGSFLEVDGLIEKYGSTWGVVTSSPSAPFRIAAHAVKEIIKFPFGVGFQLLFLTAGWLVPCALVAVVRRDIRGPVLGAVVIGLLLTGIGSRGWLHYYIVFLPLLAAIVALGIKQLARGHRGLALMTWTVILGSTVIWSPPTVWQGLRSTNWSEFTAARTYLDRLDSTIVVSSTAGTLRYGAKWDFVDQSRIMRPADVDSMARRLRDHGVTHLVISERHTLFEFPSLRALLADSVVSLPRGLERDTLITSPLRLAIYRVSSPSL